MSCARAKGRYECEREATMKQEISALSAWVIIVTQTGNERVKSDLEA